MKDDDVHRTYRALGYDEVNAEILTDFAREEKAASLMSGPLGKRYADEVISDDTLRDELEGELGDRGKADELTSAARKRRNRALLIREYKSGLATRDELRERAKAAGVEEGMIDRWLGTIAPTRETKRFIRDYVSFTKSAAETIDRLKGVGYSDDAAAAVLKEVDDDFWERQINECEKSIKKRFFRFEIESVQAERELQNLGRPAPYTDIILRGWHCTRQARGRDLPTATLCLLLQRGAITQGEMFRRLQAAGWSDSEALEILENCQHKIGEKLSAELLKDAKAQAAAAAKGLKAAEKRRKEIERQQAARAKAGEAGRKKSQAIAKAKIKAAHRWEQRIEGDIGDAVDAVEAAYQHARRGLGLTPDVAIKVVEEAVKTAKGLSKQGLLAHITDAVLAFAGVSDGDSAGRNGDAT